MAITPRGGGRARRRAAVSPLPLAVWLPALGSDVARWDPVGAYAGIVGCAADLVRHDLAFLAALMRASGAGVPAGEALRP